MIGAMGAEPSHTIYRVPDNVAWIDGTDPGIDEELYLTVTPGGQTVLLKDSARVIWLVVAEGRDVLPDVAELFGISPAEIEDEVNHFLDDLVSRGLLTREEHGPDRPLRAVGKR